MIKIAMRFSPFSHKSGSEFVLPYSDWIVTAFATRIVFSKEGLAPHVIDLCIEGPVSGFTALQDLEQGVMRIFGNHRSGYFSFIISHEGKKLVLFLDRGELTYRYQNQEQTLKKKESLEIDVGEEGGSKVQTERLSLGMHKKLDWDLVLRRCDLKEILPVLFFLGQKVKRVIPFAPLIECHTEEAFLNWLQAGFRGVLVPTRKDERFLGLPWEGIREKEPLVNALYDGYKSIKELFIKEEKEHLYLLPNLFRNFHAGRLLDAKTSFGRVDLEWAKRTIKKVEIRVDAKKTVILSTSQKLSKARLKRHPKEKGVTILLKEELSLEPHQRYLLDKFE